MLRDILVMVPTIIVTIIVGIMSARKRKKAMNKVMTDKKCLRELEFRILTAHSDTDIKLSFLSKYAPPTYDVFLFDDYIAFTTGLVMGFGESIPDEIEIKDINFACMKYIFKTDFLLINYNRKTKEPSQFYIEGKKEDLLYIKNFIEERIRRPKIIDLTDGDQTE